MVLVKFASGRNLGIRKLSCAPTQEPHWRKTQVIGLEKKKERERRIPIVGGGGKSSSAEYCWEKKERSGSRIPKYPFRTGNKLRKKKN